jgi:glycosyltransferase involved in cell wall biosynthesis
VADAFAFTEAHPDRVARFREQAPVRRAARAAARIVTISAWSRAEIARELGLSPERIAVVPPAPDPFWTPGTGDALPAALAGRRFALVVGVREARKNARLALEACARALHGEDELLVIAGELSPVDRAFARSRGLRCGEIAPSDGMLRALYRAAAVALVPSLAEGFGLVAVEAMACGTPVLAANGSALPETTGGAAVLLDPADPEAWAREIRAVLDDGERAAMLRRGGLAFVARTDPFEPARALLALLGELARGSAEA